ncbi:MAG: 2-aminoadipate transaminase [Clostridia bacterium]|jgi:DNA-binding transcriptional MocR family regulator|nr:2-aminoadipate transaminase [Clostridia bacterium]
MENLYALRAQKATNSELTELFRMSGQPDVISFAGGLPDPAWFQEEIDDVASEILKNHRKTALQYGPVPGITFVREFIAERMTKQNMSSKTENILITSGALQGLDLVCKVFVDPGDLVLVEAPTYLGAISTIESYEAEVDSIACDEDGLKVDELEEFLKNTSQKPKFIYVIPTFQNPSGRVMSLERRKKLIDTANKYEIPIVEDHAYGELRFSGQDIPTLKGLDTEGRVIFLGTFSKILSPGIRLGWIAASEFLINKLILFKQGTDQMSSSLSQLIAYEAGKRGLIDKQIEVSKKNLRQKRDVLIKALEKYFGNSAKWVTSEGGFFTWVEIDKDIDTLQLLYKACDEYKVAYVAGPSFFVDRSGKNSLRISYSLPNIDIIEEGVKRLYQVFNQ